MTEYFTNLMIIIICALPMSFSKDAKAVRRNGGVLPHRKHVNVHRAGAILLRRDVPGANDARLLLLTLHHRGRDLSSQQLRDDLWVIRR